MLRSSTNTTHLQGQEGEEERGEEEGEGREGRRGGEREGEGRGEGKDEGGEGWGGDDMKHTCCQFASHHVRSTCMYVVSNKNRVTHLCVHVSVCVYICTSVRMSSRVRMLCVLVEKASLLPHRWAVDALPPPVQFGHDDVLHLSGAGLRREVDHIG